MKNNIRVLVLAAVFSLISPDLFSQVPGFLLPDDYGKHICVSHELCRKYHNYGLFQAKGEPLRRNYNVVRYDLYLDWYETLLHGGPENAIFWGIQTVQIEFDSNDVSSVEFDAVDMKIDSVMDGKGSSLDFTYAGGKLSVKLIEVGNIGNVAVVQIYYSVARNYNWGFNVYQKGEYEVFGRKHNIEENIAYTFGQPEVSRYWMPCNDHPHDKALSSIAIRVPYEYTALANGRIDSVLYSEHAEYKTYYYSSHEPISTYLMVAVASVYKHFSDEYIRVSDSLQRVPINYYVWQSDYDGDFTKGSLHDAKRSLSLNPAMLSLFSGYFGEFPYESYGIVAIEPVWYGGMEHPNMVTINRQWLRGYGEIGLAHEVAHQWIGNMITCATWQDIWINEGGASWCEALWYEYRHKDSSQYRFLISNHARHYLNHPASWRVPVWGIASDSVFIHSRVSYSKSAFIYNMLHYYFGREHFFAFLRDFMAENYFGAVTTKNFEDALVKYFPDEEAFIGEFFRDWVYSPGHPTYRVDYDVSPIDGGSYNLRFNISQVHEANSVPDVYISRVPLLFYKDEKIVEKYFYLHDKRRHEFDVEIGFVPDSVVIDRSEVLYRLVPGMTSIRTELAGAPGLVLLPNPVYAGAGIGVEFEVARSSSVGIWLFDELGRVVLEFSMGFLEEGNYRYTLPSQGIASGVYNVVVSAGELILTGRVVLAD